jgi:hypothetical protein
MADTAAALHTAKLLILQYRLSPTVCPSIGVVLYSPEADSLYMRLIEDFTSLDDDDVEILAGTASTFEAMARENGAKATYEWMECSLSNTVVVDGPFEIFTTDLLSTISELYELHCCPLAPGAHTDLF